jgi:hypothetical protein
MWNCDSGKTTAIGLHLVCNGMADCVDDSDEKHCRCRSPADDFDCTAWQKWARRTYEEFSNEPNCIPRSLVCDGVPNCRNGADELPMLCSIVNPIIEDSDTFSLSKLFDITKKQPAYIIIIFAIIFAILILSIGCCIYCCYRRRKMYQNNKPFFEQYHLHPNASTTLLSTQRTMMTNAAASPHQHFTTARVTMPSNPSSHHQVDIALRTYPCSNTGSDYGYIPSHIHPPQPSSTATYHLHGHGQPPTSTYGYHTLPYNRHQQHQQHINLQSSYNPHLQIIPSSTTDLLPAPNNGADLNMAFYAPPPSAASLSTYGVVKPAFMPQNITPKKSTRERASSRRLEKASTLGRRSNRQEEDKLKDELFNFSGPPSYSQIGSALECSTPRSDRPPPRTKSGRHQRERELKIARQQMQQQQRVESSSLSSDSESSDLVPSQRLACSLPQQQQGSSSSGPSGAIPPTNSCNNSNSSGSIVKK